MDASTTNGNNTPYSPTAEERSWMKAHHRIGWHARGGWCRIFPGERSRAYFGKVVPGEAVRAMHTAEDRRAKLEAAEVRLTNLSVKEAVNLYLNHLDRELSGKRIGDVQRASYGDELARFASVIGKTRALADVCRMGAPEAIFTPLRATAVARGLFAAEKHITQVRTFLDWCCRVRRFITPPNYGDSFDAPTEKEKRANRKTKRKDKGVAYWTPGEVRELVTAALFAGPHRHAQVLLMLNGGMGSTDLSNLEDADVDWNRRCIHTDRSKTLVPRVVPLWDDTYEAMKVSREVRAKPADPKWSNRFFLTDRGRPLVTDEIVREGKGKGRKTSRRDALKNWFYRMINGGPLPHLKRHGAGAYTLRAVFTTLATGHGQDQNLESVILGQKFAGRPVLQFYLRGDLREKLVKIVDHVRAQIWTTPPL